MRILQAPELFASNRVAIEAVSSLALDGCLPGSVRALLGKTHCRWAWATEGQCISLPMLATFRPRSAPKSGECGRLAFVCRDRPKACRGSPY